MWLLVWIATFLLVSSVIGYFTFKFNKSGKDPLWFRTLVKSRLEPPGYVYGIVFPLQDISLAILGWNLSSMPEFIEGYQYFWIQMVLKWIYGPVIFTFHQKKTCFNYSTIPSYFKWAYYSYVVDFKCN